MCMATWSSHCWRKRLIFHESKQAGHRPACLHFAFTSVPAHVPVIPPRRRCRWLRRRRLRWPRLRRHRVFHRMAGLRRYIFRPWGRRRFPWRRARSRGRMSRAGVVCTLLGRYSGSELGLNNIRCRWNFPGIQDAAFFTGNRITRPGWRRFARRHTRLRLGRWRRVWQRVLGPRGHRHIGTAAVSVGEKI
jgi:hypothetical protein